MIKALILIIKEVIIMKNERKSNEKNFFNYYGNVHFYACF